MTAEQTENVPFDPYNYKKPDDHFCIAEISKIQETLKPLGYEVTGFREKYKTSEILLYLRYAQSIIGVNPSG